MHNHICDRTLGASYSAVIAQSTAPHVYIARKTCPVTITIKKLLDDVISGELAEIVEIFTSIIDVDRKQT